MKILFWVPYPKDGASNRYRVEQYLPYLKDANIRYYLHPFWSDSAFKILYKTGHYFTKVYFSFLGTVLRLIDVLFIFKYDIVFIHREAFPVGGAFFENVLWFLGKPIIFDFDDAIFLSTSSQQNRFIKRFKDHRKICSIIKKSNYVIAGNRYLADFALRYNPSVSVLSTPIDTNKYLPFVRLKHNDDITIGWVGSSTTVCFLELIEDVFVTLSRRYCNIKFKIMGGDFSIKGCPNVISKPWLLNEEIEELKDIDIGIMPMPDNEWSKGKCGFKAILYMSMGIPTVASDVGVNNEIILDGQNGFLVKNNQEWINRLSMLIENPELREKLGKAGRETIENKFSVKVNAMKYIYILQNVYTGKH